MHKTILAAALVVALTFAGACGDGDSNTNDGNNPQATAADAGTSATGSDLPGIDDITPAAAAPGIPELDASAEVQRTTDGLVYIDEVVGTGPAVQEGQTLTVNYTGWLANGTKFDSSLNPGRQPIQFVVGAGEVISGWDEGLASMNVGGKRRLVIPPDLAYGAEGRQPTIPGNAVLIFDVELLAAN